MQHLDEGTLQAWLDGARSGFDPSRLDAIGRHIAQCDLCASRADALERSSFRAHALLSMGRDDYAPRVPYEDVVRRARGSRRREPLLSRRIPATWAASIVAAVAVGWVSNELYRADDGAAVVASADAAASAAATPQTPARGSPQVSAPASGAASEPTDVLPTAANAALAAADAFVEASGPGVAAEAVAAPRAAATTVLAGAPSVRNASDGLVVRGVVEDEGGRPVPSAQVYVAELDVGVLTQRDGRYDLRLANEPDSFELTVQRIGFRQQTRAISGGEGDYVAADFRLREEALALDEIVVTGESDGGQRRPLGSLVTNPRATPFVWRPAPSIAAEGYVGSDLWTLPGLDVLTLEVAYGNNPNETHVARVQQDLGNGMTVTLIQGRTDGRRTRWPIHSEGAVLSTWRGEMLITATAPISTDSLGVLLRQLR